MTLCARSKATGILNPGKLIPLSAGQLRRHEIGKVTALTNPLSGHGAAVKAHGAIARH